MDDPAPASRPIRSSRRWRIPPALSHDIGGDLLEGMPVLRDFAGAPLSVLLWQGAREVMLWAGAGERDGLFSPGAYSERLAALRKLNVPEAVGPLLRALGEAVLGEPEHAEGEYVSLLCHQVSEWAMEAGAGETALWYAQAAAVAAPDLARAALRAGAVALQLGKLQRAESWLFRAIGLARRRDWKVYAFAYLALAGAAEQRPDQELARRRYTRAHRIARRAGLREVRGQALHGLLRLALDGGALDDANRFGLLARRSIGPDHPDRASLDVDLAMLHVQQGETGQALRLLQSLLGIVADPARRTYLLALQALAHALAGHPAARVADAWTAAWAELAREQEPPTLRIRSLLALAAAARATGDLRRAAVAEDAARASVRTALDRWLVERHGARAHGSTGK